MQRESICGIPDTTALSWTLYAVEDPDVSRKQWTSHNLVDLLTPIKAYNTKQNQPSRGSPEPIEVVDILARDFEIPAKHSCNNIHGKDDRSKHR